MDQTTSDLIGQRKQRIDNTKKLRELGIDPYPAVSKKDVSNQTVKDEYSSYQDKEVTLAGRLVAKREHGKLIFGDIQDQSGSIQIAIKQDELIEDLKKSQLGWDHLKLIDVGDIIQVTGTVGTTQQGEVTLFVTSIKLLVKSIRPLPNVIHDKEIMHRQRYLDLILNHEKLDHFAKVAQVTFAIREFLNSKGFLEIKTPILQPLYGGTMARPFKTSVNALDTDFYLAVSHELYLKRLITAGYENVYNLVGYFRNEGIDRSHNPEFTMIETMTAYQNYEYNMKLIEEMYEYIARKVFNKTEFEINGEMVDFSKPWQRLSMLEAVKKYTQVDFNSIKTIEQAHKALKDAGIEAQPFSIGECMRSFFEEKVEANLLQPTFITGHPVEISPLAKSMDSDPRFVERFEIFIGGIEGGDNWTELNDPVELFERFKEQHRQRQRGSTEFHPIDIEFVEMMEYGMPPTTGLGPGIERLTMMLTGKNYIDDIIFFPLMKPAPITKTQIELYGEEFVSGVQDNKKESTASKAGEKGIDLSAIPDVNLVSIEKDVAEKFPGIKTGFLVLQNVKVEPTNDEIKAFKKTIADAVKTRFGDKSSIKDSARLKGFQEIYKGFGVDPRKRLNSAESLIRRLVDGKGFYTINNVVDMYNITSAEFELPMAAYDLDAIKGKIVLRFAKEGDEMTKILETESTPVEAGELVYADDEGVTCLDFNYRDSDRTKITPNAKRIIVFVDGHTDISENVMKDALSVLGGRLEQFTGGKVIGKNIIGNDLKNTMSLPTREEAMKLLEEHVKEPYQILHAKMAAAGMEEYAEKLGANKELWYITGLLHDLDYFKHPDAHPNESMKWFAEWKYPEELIHAVAAHAHSSGRTEILPSSQLDFALIACDELSGLLYAYSLMRPTGFEGMEAKSVMKKFKDKAFAAKIDREEIMLGVEGLGLDLKEHMQTLIEVFNEMRDLKKIT